MTLFFSNSFGFPPVTEFIMHIAVQESNFEEAVDAFVDVLQIRTKYFGGKAVSL